MSAPKATERLMASRATRAAAQTAHDEGRHGDGTKADVVEHWRHICACCEAVWRYEFRDAK